MDRKTENSSVNNHRRNIIKIFWTILGIIAFAEIIAVCFSFIKPFKKKKKSLDTSLVDAGMIENYTPGSVSAFVNGRFYLVYHNSGGFLAISSQCTHLGCSLPWLKEEKKFVCPCHASEFDMTGKVLSSPAPRAMDLYKIEIKNNRIFVDISRKIKRNSFNKEQLVFPDEIKTISNKT